MFRHCSRALFIVVMIISDPPLSVQVAKKCLKKCSNGIHLELSRLRPMEFQSLFYQSEFLMVRRAVVSYGLNNPIGRRALRIFICVFLSLFCFSKGISTFAKQFVMVLLRCFAERLNDLIRDTALRIFT